jgi:pyruvate,water dikinase
VSAPVRNPHDDPWDPLHEWSPPDLHWTTTNVSENLPGVPTPLTWTVWRRATEVAQREAGYALGIYSSEERRPPERLDDCYFRIFYGHFGWQLESLIPMGDRMPGTSGEQVAKTVVGRVPDDMAYRRTMRRYPIIAWRLPYTFATVPRRLAVAGRESEAWYLAQLPRIPSLDRAGATQALVEGADMFRRMMALQSTTVLGVVSPMYDLLERLVARLGVGDVAVLSGTGGAEMVGLVGDIWKTSRGELALAELQRRHGFNGPMEGELAGRVWREDPEPLRALVAEYARREDAADPLRHDEARRRQRIAMMRLAIAAAPRAQRPAIRIALGLAARNIPLRGVAKRYFLQGLDGARAAARRVGECLAAEGQIDVPDDVFYLTFEEIIGALPPGARELVSRRRERRAEYERLGVPTVWKGMPTPILLEAHRGEETIAGIGVSPGVAEGQVRVVMDPNFADIEPDEILVAPTTNPSWASVMFVSKALVVDIGGPLSHAGVVARELGLPCVLNTRSGTRSLRTGDRVRVDGTKGTVEILERSWDERP